MTETTPGGDMPDTPSTRAASESPTHPAAEAAAPGRHGAPPGTIASGDEKGPGQEGTVRDPSITASLQDEHWRRRFAEREYTDEDRGYDYYRPAFRYGWESRAERPGKRFEDVEAELRTGWDARRHGLDWDEARPAVRDAWDQAYNIGGSTEGNPLA